MNRLLTTILLLATFGTAVAKDYTLSTPNTTIILSAEQGKQLYFRYYGAKAEASDVRAAGRMMKYDAYPAFGTRCDAPYASLVKQHDGDNATKFVVEKIEKVEVGSIDFLKDAAIVKMYYRSKESNNSVDTTLKAPVDEYKLKN